MLVGTDMIRRPVRKDSDVKQNSRRPVKLQSLGRHLHNRHLAARFHHGREIRLNRVGFRRRIAGRNMTVPDDRLTRSNQALSLIHI